MVSYEIRTYKARRHSSLVMLTQCPNDITAILLARDVTRKGEYVEVWRDDRLVYRVGAGSDPAGLRVHTDKKGANPLRLMRQLRWSPR
jgi:hypothetical protein